MGKIVNRILGDSNIIVEFTNMTFSINELNGEKHTAAVHIHLNTLAMHNVYVARTQDGFDQSDCLVGQIKIEPLPRTYYLQLDFQKVFEFFHEFN